MQITRNHLHQSEYTEKYDMAFYSFLKLGLVRGFYFVNKDWYNPTHQDKMTWKMRSHMEKFATQVFLTCYFLVIR